MYTPGIINYCEDDYSMPRVLALYPAAYLVYGLTAQTSTPPSSRGILGALPSHAMHGIIPCAQCGVIQAACRASPCMTHPHMTLSHT